MVFVDIVEGVSFTENYFYQLRWRSRKCSDCWTEFWCQLTVSCNPHSAFLYLLFYSLTLTLTFSEELCPGNLLFQVFYHWSLRKRSPRSWGQLIVVNVFLLWVFKYFLKSKFSKSQDAVIKRNINYTPKHRIATQQPSRTAVLFPYIDF